MILRKARRNRKTTETEITIEVILEGQGRLEGNTGIGFFDHMLEQLTRHSGIDMIISVQGDRHIDDHHTVEDVGIVLGQALDTALADRASIMRYGSVTLPMDEALTRAAIDVSGRPFLVCKLDFTTTKIGQFDTELIEEFFQALTTHAKITLHIQNIYGENNHHIAESAFKAVARALRQAITIDEKRKGAIPSTKGTLSNDLA